MGVRGPIGQGLRHGYKPIVLPALNEAQIVPEPPIKLRAPTRAKWDGLWRSQVARFIDLDADMGALERWCDDWNEYYRIKGELKRRPFITGSAGQAILNPMHGVLTDIIKRLEKWEDDFAARPKARVRLNLDGLNGALTAATLNRMIQEQDDDNGDKDEDWQAGFAASS